MATFWLENPCILLSSLNINPFDMSNSKAENYNALTRIILILMVIFYIYLKKPQVIYTGLISLLVVIVLYKLSSRDYYSEVDFGPNAVQEPEKKSEKELINENQPEYDYENTRRDLLNKNKLQATREGLQNTKGVPDFVTQFSKEESQRLNKYDRTQWFDFKYLPPNEKEIASFRIPEWSQIKADERFYQGN